MSLSVIVAVLFSWPDAVCTAQLDRLLARHQEYGLPLPPPDAALVQFALEPGKVFCNTQGRRENLYPGERFLGFSLDGRTVLGSFNKRIEPDSIASAKPDPATLGEDLKLADLTLALQCHSRGWTFLSRAAYREWRLREIEGPGARWSSDEEGLESIAWDHWLIRLSYEPGTPLPLVAKHLKRILLDADPKGEFEYNRDLVRSLELALVPRNSRPGSDEALIDALVELAGLLDSDRPIKEPRTNPYYQDAIRNDPLYLALVRRGFEAVPALIDHLGDERATRLVRHVNFQLKIHDVYHCRVKDVALDLLRELAGEQLVEDKADVPTRVQAARKWFEEARKVGEERYVVSRVVEKINDNKWLRKTLFWLLCNKYPQRVPEVYRELIGNHPTLVYESWQFAKAVAQGPLPAAEKRKILEYAARQPDLHHCAAGVKFLRTFDAKQAHDLLLAGLDRLSGRLSDGALTLVEVAAEHDDPREWQALAKALRRADVGSRLELLKVIAEEPAPAGRKKRLVLLADYLTDDAVRDKDADPERYKWDDIAGGDFDRLEVRNFAAILLAQIAKLDDIIRVDWTAAQWAELRERIRAAVANELGR
jgi:hypothetical protein